MRVQDVMTRNVRTVAPAASAADAWELMRRCNIHHLVVVRDGDVLGVLSERDAGGPRGTAVRANRAVADLMTTPAVTVAPTLTIRRAANMMRGRAIGCLVVVQAGRPIGIVTVSDLLALLGRGLDRGAVSHTRPTLNHRVPHRKAKTASGVW
jgi:CBS domain-containing protein